MDGRALVEQHGRAVGEQLDLGLARAAAASRTARRDPLGQLRRSDMPGSGRTPTSTTQRSGTTLIAEPPWTVPTLSGT